MEKEVKWLLLVVLILLIVAIVLLVFSWDKISLSRDMLSFEIESIEDEVIVAEEPEVVEEIEEETEEVNETVNETIPALLGEPKSSDSHCSFGNLTCKDYIITPGNIFLSLEYNSSSKISIKEFNGSLCVRVSKRIINEEQIFIFDDCANGVLNQFSEISLELTGFLNNKDEFTISGSVKDKVREFYLD